jgi:hypothetical protein
MKKTILLLALALTPELIFAQTAKADSITKWDKSLQTEEYVMVTATAKPFSSKVSISLDYGQSVKPFSGNYVQDENGRAVFFNSVVDALNYMNSQGWEFINAYTITVSNQNVYHYLMKRKIKK